MRVKLGLALVPVTVSEYVPAVADPVATVIVDALDPLSEGGLKLALAPAGNPLTDKVTVPAKPPAGVTAALYVVLVP